MINPWDNDLDNYRSILLLIFYLLNFLQYVRWLSTLDFLLLKMMILQGKESLTLLITTPGRRQSKTFILSTNVDQKLSETEFSIAICRLIGDKWQLKTLFLAIFYTCWSIVKSVCDCRLPGVITHQYNPQHQHQPYRNDFISILCKFYYEKATKTIHCNSFRI